MFTRVLCMLLIASLSGCRSARIKAKVDLNEGAIDLGVIRSAAGTSHPVHILLTRHGLSCANIVSNFVKSKLWSKHHVSMKDPLLCDAGVKFARELKPKVQEALKSEHNLPQPDAVLASVLVRAVETALLQYDGSPVFVVPHIKEHGFGKDNDYNDRSIQMSKLKAKYPDDKWSVDYQYAEVYGYEHDGDWDNFVKFLRLVFLPDLIKQSGKRSGEPIVLAVVSHSNFMNKGVVFDECKSYFPNNPKSPKSNNNQVVKLSYEFISRDDHNATARDVTPESTLAALQGTPFCQNVVSGLSIYEGGSTVSLCKSDIGDECWMQIKNEGGSSFPSTVEDEIEKMSVEIEKLREQLETKPPKDSSSMVQQLAEKIAEREALSTKKCFSGGLPTTFGA